MMLNRSFTISIILLASLFMVGTCLAHNITLFGYVDEGMVKTEAKFSGGRAAKHCQVSMITSTAPEFVGETDDAGMLNFPVPAEIKGFDLVVTCGDGHRGTWRIEAEELPGTSPVEQQQHSHLEVSLSPPETAPLRLLIREELARELGPIKRQLAELKRDTVTLADIMGGLGYFFGLAGLASYMRFRKDRK